MKKELIIKTEIQATNTPVNWTFNKECNGIDQIAMLVITINALQKKLDEMLGKK